MNDNPRNINPGDFVVHQGVVGIVYRREMRFMELMIPPRKLPVLGILCLRPGPLSSMMNQCPAIEVLEEQVSKLEYYCAELAGWHRNLEHVGFPGTSSFSPPLFGYPSELKQ